MRARTASCIAVVLPPLDRRPPVTRRAAGAIVALCALALASVTLPAASAGEPISYYRTSWNWGAPAPQGQDLLAVDFDGSTGYAAGFYGTVLRSDDAGRSWRELRPPTRSALLGVQIAPGGGIVTFSCREVLRSADGGQTFSKWPVGDAVSRCLETLEFVTPSVGFAVADDGEVLRTNDGGRSFAPISKLPSVGAYSTVVDVAFRDERVGFASLRATDESDGALFRTTDGALTWERLQTPVRGDGEIDLPDGAVYVAARGQLLRSTDDGRSFAARPLPPGAEGKAASLVCASESHCLVFGEKGGLVTVDGGATFQPAGGLTEAYSAAFAARQRVIALGSLGATAVSADGGRTFTPVGGGSGPLYDGPLRASGPLTAHALALYGDQPLVRTVDGGRSWSPIAVPFDEKREEIVDFAFADRRFGFALAEGLRPHDGPYPIRLLRTADGGQRWTQVARGDSRRYASVFAFGPRRSLRVGPAGIALSADGGRRFRAVYRGMGLTLDDFDRGKSALAAWGSGGAALSTTGGRRWRRLRTPRGRIADLELVDRRRIFVAMRSGAALSSRDGGRSWRRMIGVGRRIVSQVSFSDARNGYLGTGSLPAHVDPFGFDSGSSIVLRTSDGGRSWRPQFRLPTQRLREVLALTPRRAIAAVTGDLAWTASGGDARRRTRLSLSSVPRGRTRPGPIRVRGRLRPARRGDEILLSIWNGRRFAERKVAVGPSGRFAASLRRRKPVSVVAQWTSDGSRQGAATAPVRISVGGAPR